MKTKKTNIRRSSQSLSERAAQNDDGNIGKAIRYGEYCDSRELEIVQEIKQLKREQIKIAVKKVKNISLSNSQLEEFKASKAKLGLRLVNYILSGADALKIHVSLAKLAGCALKDYNFVSKKSVSEFQHCAYGIDRIHKALQCHTNIQIPTRAALVSSLESGKHVTQNTSGKELVIKFPPVVFGKNPQDILGKVLKNRNLESFFPRSRPGRPKNIKST